MSNITFLSSNLVETAALSLVDGTANAQFPLSNIKHKFTTKVFRSTTGSIELVLDLGATMPVDTIAFGGDAVKKTLGFNSATLKGSGSLDFSGSTVHTVDLSNEFNFGFKMFTSESNRYWKITLTGVGYVEISNIYLGQKTVLTNNDFSTTSFKWSSIDGSKIVKNMYGQKFIDERNMTQILSGDITLISAPEYAILSEIYSRHGKSKPVWFILDPNSAMDIDGSEFQFSGYFYLTKDFKWNVISKGYYAVQIDLDEAI